MEAYPRIQYFQMCIRMVYQIMVVTFKIYWTKILVQVWMDYICCNFQILITFNYHLIGTHRTELPTHIIFLFPFHRTRKLMLVDGRHRWWADNKLESHIGQPQRKTHTHANIAPQGIPTLQKPPTAKSLNSSYNQNHRRWDLTIVT